MTRLRVMGGRHRGRSLRVPAGVRPTEGRLREALFSIWQGELPGARVLDLFAGAGAVGLEAVARGAAAAVLVEGDPRVYRTLEENVAALGLGKEVTTYRLRLPAGLAVVRQREAAFDLVFADPPYAFAAGSALLAAAAPVLASGGVIAYEHGAREDAPAAPPGFELVETRAYGGSALSFYAQSAAPSGAQSPREPVEEGTR